MNFIKYKAVYILFAVLPFLMILAISIFGWDISWQFFQIPSISPPFFDFRILPAIVLSDEAGFNPQQNNPYDPAKRLLNYPLVWIKIAQLLNLSNQYFFYLVVFTILIIYLNCCYKLLTLSKSYWVIFIFFSGSSLLAMERANTDLIIFILLYYSVVTPKPLGIILTISAIILKLYPLFSIVIFYKNTKLFAIGLIISIIIFYIYRHQLFVIVNNTQISYGASYGSLAITSAINAKLNFYVSKWWINSTLIIISFLFLIIKKPVVEYSNITEIDVDLCIVGSSIYVGSFLIMSNWDYRLIFLNLCLPVISKIKVFKLKQIIYTLLLLSCNQFVLHYLFGQAGAIVNVVAKIFVFNLCLIFGLIVLKEKYFIFNQKRRG